MYRSFSVKNFRGISSLQLSSLSKVNLLTGLNDAGKTSVLEAIHLHASASQAGVAAVTTLLQGRHQDLQVAQTQQSSVRSSPWVTFFHNFDESIPIQLGGRTTVPSYDVDLSQDPNPPSFGSIAGGPLAENSTTLASTINVTVKRGNNPAKKYTQSLITQTTSIGLAQNVTVQFRIEPDNDKVKIFSVFIGGGRGVDLASAYSDYQVQPNGLDLLKALRIVDDRIENLEVLVVGGRPQLHARVDGVLVLFQLLGDGPAEIARVLLSMGAASGGVMLIDEVGAGVHYSVLPEMWSTFHQAAEMLNVQLFATTHSQESVIAAQSALGKADKNLSVYRLSRPSAGQPTEVTAYSGGVLETAVELNAELR